MCIRDSGLVRFRRARPASSLEIDQLKRPTFAWSSVHPCRLRQRAAAIAVPKAAQTRSLELPRRSFRAA
eukprot:12639281-Alexandrium_andersonii.AAC.1